MVITSTTTKILFQGASYIKPFFHSTPLRAISSIKLVTTISFLIASIQDRLSLLQVFIAPLTIILSLP